VAEICWSVVSEAVLKRLRGLTCSLGLDISASAFRPGSSQRG
jgi:hypothetical protein